MISRIKGELVEKAPPQLVVDVHGVGYEVEVSMSTFFKLPAVGAPVTIYTQFIVREDAQLLYGFADKYERSVFRLLVKVNGVGPKMALAILSGMTPSELANCMQREDVVALTRIPGVGKKTAERLIVELRDKLQAAEELTEDPLDFQLSGESLPVSQDDQKQAREDAESALLALGYKPAQASKAVASAERELGDARDSEALIRAALKAMLAG